MTNSTEKKKGKIDSLILSIASGLATGLVTAVIYTLISKGVGWSTSIALLVALVTALAVFLFMTRYPKVMFRIVVIILFTSGLGLILASYRETWWQDLTWNPSIVGLGIAIISISLGAFGMNASQQSDKKMEAMAKMQYYTRMANLHSVMKDLSPDGSNEYHEAHAKHILFDLKATKQLAEWMGEKEQTETNEIINNLIDKTLDGQEHEQLIKSLLEAKEDGC